MMFHSATDRGLLRNLGVGAVALILGLGGPAPRAFAEAADDAKTTDKTDKARAPKGILAIGDEAIDPNQPIRSEFIINVSVSGEPDPSGNYKVDSVGNVAIRYAGIMTPVSIKNMTPAQAQDTIAGFLKTYIKNPVVKVTIVDTPRPTVFIGGAVRNNGQIIINADTTLLDVLTRAEYTDNADLTQVRIIRKEVVDGKEVSKPIFVDFEKFIKSRATDSVDESLNPVLHDKDKVVVPSRNLPGTGSISVFGEVTHPTPTVPLRTTTPLTVREVINLAGGATQTADRHRVSIRRAGVDKPLIIDLDKAEQGDLVNNIELKPDDTVYVEKLENNSYVNITGGFVRPGKLIYDKRTTLTQAVAESGGVAPFAKIKEGYITRHPDSDPKHTRIIAFNWKEVQTGKAQDIELQPGDSIYIEPGTQPRPGLGPLEILGGLGSAGYLFNTIRGRGY